MHDLTWPMCALAGGTGATLRALAVHTLTERVGMRMWKTLLLVNVSGCVAAGAGSVWLHRVDASGTMSMVALSGLLGGFTTFSSYAVECVELWRRGERGRSARCAIGSMIVCVAGVHLGASLVPGAAA